MRRRTRKTVATTTLTPKRRCSGRSRGHNHARTTLPHVCQSGGSKAIPTPTAAAMSVPALAAAAAVSDGGGNSGEPGDDGDWQSNSSTGGTPPLKDTKLERGAPGSAWASGQLAAARLKTCTHTVHVWGGTASGNANTIPAGVCAFHLLQKIASLLWDSSPRPPAY